MWQDIASTGIKVKNNKDIENDNKKVKKLQESIKPSGVGIDVADWATDNVYFSRIFKKYSTAQTKADGTEMDEKVLSKDGGETSLREILTEKIDTKGDKKKALEQVDHLMNKFFSDNWEYVDAANEGFIETSRATQFIHKIINQIKLDDEEEGLMWKAA